MNKGLTLVLIIAAAILISAAFLAPGDTDKGSADSSDKTSFVAKILAGLDFTGGKTVASAITESQGAGTFEKLKINPFGDSP